jgi:hypothetical protein
MQPPLTHFASPDYWPLHNRLPADVRQTADKFFALLKSDPRHSSLRLKEIGDLWSVRAGIHYRAVGMDAPFEEKAILWFWFGSHAEYDRVIKRR